MLNRPHPGQKHSRKRPTLNQTPLAIAPLRESRAGQTTVRKRQRAILRRAVLRDHDLRGRGSIVRDHFTTRRRRGRLTGDRHRRLHRANDRARGWIREQSRRRRNGNHDALHCVADNARRGEVSFMRLPVVLSVPFDALFTVRDVRPSRVRSPSECSTHRRCSCCCRDASPCRSR